MARILRFAVVGGSATFAHVGIALIFRSTLQLSDLLANLAGFCAALAISYVGHARFTFGVDMRAAQVPHFVAAALIGLVTSSGVVWLVDIGLGWGFPVAMALVAVTVPMVSYLLLRFWVFDGRRAVDWSGLLLSAGLSAIFLAASWGRMINHDTAWYLIATREWLSGATLYRDIIEVNPPLNFYFTLPVIGLADATGLSDTNAQYVVLALSLFVSVSWCGTLLLRLGLPALRRLVLLAGLMAALVLPALNNLAQREHILVILLMPWLLGRLVPQSRQAELLQALVAGMAICLKPFFLLFPLAVTLCEVATTRSLRPVLSISNLTMLVVGISYVGFVTVVHPAYFAEIVPMARLTYSAYGAGLSIIWAQAALPALFLGLVALTVLPRRSEPGPALFCMLALAGLGCFLWQGTGFGYHLIPFLSFILVACFWALSARGMPLATRLTVLVLLAMISINNLPRGFYANGAVTGIVGSAASGGKVERLAVLSTYVHAGPQVAIALGAEWISRFPAVWPLPGAFDGLATTDCSALPDLCSRLHTIADHTREALLDDIAQARPDLLVIDRRPGYFRSPDFSWYRYMGGDPRWQQILSHYLRAGEAGRFELWRRQREPITR